MNSNLPIKQIINYIKSEREELKGKLSKGSDENGNFTFTFPLDKLTSHLIVLDEIESKLNELEASQNWLELHEKALKCLPEETIKEFYGFMNRALDIQIRERENQ